MTSLDEAVLPRELQMLKAFLPFLPAPAQKMLAIYIKWTELQNTIAYFNQHPPVQKSLDERKSDGVYERNCSTGGTGADGTVCRYV